MYQYKLLYDVVLLDQLQHISAIATTEAVSFDAGKEIANKLAELTKKPWAMIDEMDLANDELFPMWSFEEH